MLRVAVRAAEPAQVTACCCHTRVPKRPFGLYEFNCGNCGGSALVLLPTQTERVAAGAIALVWSQVPPPSISSGASTPPPAKLRGH